MWGQVSSSEFKWVESSSNEFTWVHVGSKEFMWVQLNSIEFRWVKWVLVSSHEFKFGHVSSSFHKWFLPYLLNYSIQLWLALSVYNMYLIQYIERNIMFFSCCRLFYHRALILLENWTQCQLLPVLECFWAFLGSFWCLLCVSGPFLAALGQLLGCPRPRGAVATDWVPE